MPRPSSVVTALLTGVCLPGLPLHAQDPSDSAGYRALTQTPLAAFVPGPTASLTGIHRSGPALQLRYGLVSYGDNTFTHSFGLGGDVAVGSGRLGIMGGDYHPACGNDTCPGHFMAALTYSDNLLGATLGRPGSRATINVGLDLGVGYGAPHDGTLLAASASMPIALVPAGRAVRFFSFVAPGLGGGSAPVNGRTEQGLRARFSAGVGVLLLDEHLGAIVGVDRVFLRGGNWVAGVGLTWTGGHSTR